MTDRSSIEALIKQLYAARVAGDLDGVRRCFGDGAAMSIAGASDSNPIAISARGGEEVRRLLTMIIKSFRLTEYEAKAVLVDGTRAAVHWRANIHSRITGSSSSTEFLTLLEFEGAHITGYTELFVRRQG